MVDELLNTCRASPTAKAAQLGQECQALVTNLDSWSGLSLAVSPDKTWFRVRRQG